MDPQTLEPPGMQQHMEDNSSPSDVLFDFLNRYDEDGFINSEYISDFANSDNEEVTLLQFATINGLSRAVKSLLNHGADPNKTTTKNVTTPLEIAAMKNQDEILDLFLNHEIINIPSRILMKILRNADYKTDRIINLYDSIFKDKLDVNIYDEDDNTPLHFAVAHSSSKAISYLLRAGASVVCTNKYGVRPVENIDAGILEAHLNECLEADEATDIKEINFPAVYKYRTVMPPQGIRNKETTSEKEIPQLRLVSEIQIISYINESEKLKHLLRHPVITSFLYIKWYRILWLFYTSLAFYIAFCLSLVLYVLVVYSNRNDNEYRTVDSILFSLLCVTLSSLVLRELSQIVISIYPYSKNLTKLTLIILTTIIIFQRSGTLRKEVSALAILSVAYELITLIGQLSKVSTKIIIWRTVFRQSLYIILWRLVLLLTLSLSFFTVMFIGKDKSDSQNSSGIKNDGDISLVKIVLVLTSYINYQTYCVINAFMIALVLFSLLRVLRTKAKQLEKNNFEPVVNTERIEYIAYIESVLFYVIQSCYSLLPSKIIKELLFFMVKILVEGVLVCPYFLKDYRAAVYLNQRARVALIDSEKYSKTRIYLDKQTANRTKQLILKQRMSKKRTVSSR